MAVNERYSGKAFPYHGVSFKDRPAAEFNNSEIERSCFYQEWADDGDVMKDIFPDGMTGVTFQRCNVDNVFVDETKNTIEATCSHRTIKMQNDWDDWTLDVSEKPVEPLNKAQRIAAGVSIDPRDIPTEKMTSEQHKQFKESLKTGD